MREDFVELPGVSAWHDAQRRSQHRRTQFAFHRLRLLHTNERLHTPCRVYVVEKSKGAALMAALLFAFMVTIIVLADVGYRHPLFVAIRQMPYGDKICHFALFGVLTYFVNRASGYRVWRIGGVPVPIGAAIIVAAATLEELSQHYFPNRTLDLGDWLADLAGIVLFTWLSRPAPHPVGS